MTKHETVEDDAVLTNALISLFRMGLTISEARHHPEAADKLHKEYVGELRTVISEMNKIGRQDVLENALVELAAMATEGKGASA